MQRRYPGLPLENNAMRENKKLRIVLSVILSFFLTAFLLVVFLCTELGVGYFSEKEFQKAIQSNSYGAQVEEELSQKLKELFAKLELPETLVDQAFEETDIYVLFHNYAEGRDARFQEELEHSFQTVIDRYLEEQQVHMTQAIQDALELLVKEAGRICERAVYPGFIAQYYEMARTVRHYLLILGIAASCLSAACIVVLFAMYHYKHRAVRYMAYSTIAATLFNLIGMWYLRYTGVLQVTGVEPDYYQQFLDQYRLQGLGPWYWVSAAGVVITVLLLMLVKRLKHTVK